MSSDKKDVSNQSVKKTDCVVKLSSNKEAPGVIGTFKKSQSASEFSTSLGLIKNVYEDSIEYTGVPKGTRGWMMFLGILFGATFVCTGGWGVMGFFDQGINGVLDIIFLSVAVGTVIGALYLAINSVRMELFRPIDEPIIFDRKNRKVYRIFRETYSGWRGLFMHWPLKFSQHDWDLVEAEHQTVLSTNGSIVTRYHALMFLVRKSNDDDTLVASFLVGNSLIMGELTVPAVWEHIRLFMENGGPHLPGAETLPPPDSPKTLGQCLAASGPYGKNFLVWWKEIDLLLVLVVVFFPILLPVFTCVAIFAWLSYKTSVAIEWPKHVLTALRA